MFNVHVIYGKVNIVKKVGTAFRKVTEIVSGNFPKIIAILKSPLEMPRKIPGNSGESSNTNTRVQSENLYFYFYKRGTTRGKFR